MAGLVKNFILLTLGLPLLVGGALAAADPTRPPDAWLQPGTTAAAGEGGLRLQSVLLPQRGRPLAIIGGQTVPLGGRYGDATLVRLSEREAVLQGADGVVRLYLTPDVDKRMIVPAAGNKARKPAQVKETR